MTKPPLTERDDRAYFRDIMDNNKMHWTRIAKFAGWTGRTGIAHVHYAIFLRGSDDMLVPYYLLTAATRARLEAIYPLPQA